VFVHPPLFTKVLGRPKKRRQIPEELENNGGKMLTKAGVKMHCSVCGNENHNKKGHDKYMEDKNASGVQVEDENGDVDNPAILQVLFFALINRLSILCPH
jgi:hypothetical protein